MKTIEFKQQLVSELDPATAGTISFDQSTKPNAQSPSPEAKLQRDTVNDLDGIGTPAPGLRRDGGGRLSAGRGRGGREVQDGGLGGAR